MGHYFADTKINTGKDLCATSVSTVASATSAAFAELADVRAIQGAPRLADMQTLSDDAHALCSAEDRDMAALLHKLLEDEGVSTYTAARAVNQPDIFVEHYRAAVGI